MKKNFSLFLLFSLLLLFILSAFSINPAPLFATALPAGRMLDEGHDTGYIDWNGSVYYENLYHRDGLCPSGCNETVTRINSGLSISGSFQRDASYFEAMAAFEWAGTGVGTVTVSACSTSTSWYMGTANNNTPGFNSISIWSAIPAGCRDWSVSASGGHVHIRSVDVYYPWPPTISGILNCSAWGSNGWCVGAETLALTASEPQGESVLISGDLNGTPFACQQGETSCSIPLPEGIGTANYQATSINGTGGGSTDWKLDTLSPDINGSLSDSPNGLNWFNTDLTLNASASDTNSGIAYFESSLDNANWTTQNSPLTLNFSDGTRTVYLHAVDRAGNIERVQYEIKVDTQAPQLTGNFTGTSGSNDWYISDVQVEITQTDPAPSSGIQYFAYSPNGGTNWINYTTPFTLTEGVYDLRMHLVDNADNQDMRSQEIKIDTTAPGISGSLDQIPNALGWINTAVNLTASASDATSGVASFESSLDNTNWTPYTAPLNFTDGIYTAYLLAKDNAGNEYRLQQEIKVDSQSPMVSHQVNGTVGENAWYISDIQVAIMQIDPAPSSGIQSFQTSLDGANWTDYTAPLDFSEGTYLLQMRVIDNADHQDLDAIPLNVDTTPPTINGTLAGQLGSANFYISPVQAEVQVSDATSGIALTEYSLNGSAWTVYTAPLTINDGTHQLQFRSKDVAGLVSYTEVFKFSVDTHGPNIKLNSRWYIWEKGELFVKDDGSKIASVSYEIRDSQGRWKKVERSWNPNTETFSHDISWNRVFTDGTLAPVGEYPVRVTAIDNAGHSNQKTARIIIPPANATPLPTFTPTPEATFTPTPTAVYTELVEVPTITPTPFVFVTPTLDAEPVEAPTQKSGGIFGFGNPPKQTNSDPQSPNPLIGITAAAVTGAYIATQRKKKVEFGSAPKTAQQPIATPNIFVGAQASALIGAFTAKMEEDRQQRAAERARKAAEMERLNILNYQAVQERIREIARAREEARRKREEAKRKKAARYPLQDLWDRNGAAIYKANQAFKKKHGRNMSARTRRKAIKDATVNGVFHIGSYATGIEQARIAEEAKRVAALRAQQEAILAEKRRRHEEQLAREAEQEKKEQQQSLADWKQADMRATAVAVDAEKKVKQGKVSGHASLIAPTRSTEKCKLFDFACHAHNIKEWQKKAWNTVKNFGERKVDQTWPALRATGPGMHGISIVNEHKTTINEIVSSYNDFVGQEKSIHPTSVALSLSIQGEAPKWIDWLQSKFDKSPSIGLAQVKLNQYDAIRESSAVYLDYSYYDIPKEPYDALQTVPVSTAAMIEKIAPVVRMCQKYECTPTDQEVVIAFAQNGDSFTADALKEILRKDEFSSDNTITIVDWQKVIDDRGAYTKEDGAYRNLFLNWRAGNRSFETRFMLQRYYYNAMEMQAQGWELSPDVDWDYINDILENTSPSDTK